MSGRFSVIFRERGVSASRTAVIPPAGDIRVRQFSRLAVGGPGTAELEVIGTARDLLEWLTWLMVKVEIYDDLGIPMWWGYISRVEVEYDRVRVSADIETMANRIATAYTLTELGIAAAGMRRTTTWSEESGSIKHFGIKELLLSMADTTEEAAEAARDAALVELSRAQAGYEIRSNGLAQPRATIYCLGWWSTLSWRYANVPTLLALAYETIGTVEEPIGKAGTIEGVAVSFTAGRDFSLGEIQVYLKKTGSPDDSVTVGIYDDAEGEPATELESATIDGGDVQLSFAWTSAVFGTQLDLVSGTVYWIVVERTGTNDASNYFSVGSDGFGGWNGSGKLLQAGNYTAAGKDFGFVVGDDQLYRHIITTGTTDVIVGTGTVSKVGQSFAVTAAFEVDRVEVYVRKVGNPTDNLQIGIYGNSGGNPGSLLASATVSGASLNTAYQWEETTLSDDLPLSAGTYWVVVERDGGADGSNYYEVNIDETATGGKVCAGSWSDAGGAMPYRVHADHAYPVVEFAGISEMQEIGIPATVERAAQAFDVSAEINLAQVGIYVKKTGSPTDELRIGIYSNPDDLTPTTELASATVSGASLNTDWEWVMLDLTCALDAGTSYFLLVERTDAADMDNYYVLRLDENQGYGAGPYVRYMVDWQDGSADMPFRLYANALVETTQQVKSLITNYGQYLKKVTVFDPAGVSSESYRDGDSNVRYEVEQLLRAGGPNGRRMLAHVTLERTVELREQSARGDRIYQVDSQGNVYDPQGNPIEGSQCPAGIWIRPRDLPILDARFIGGLQAFFLESVDYDTEQGLSWQPANLPDPWDLGIIDG